MGFASGGSLCKHIGFRFPKNIRAQVSLGCKASWPSKAKFKLFCLADRCPESHLRLGGCSGLLASTSGVDRGEPLVSRQCIRWQTSNYTAFDLPIISTGNVFSMGIMKQSMNRILTQAPRHVQMMSCGFQFLRVKLLT